MNPHRFAQVLLTVTVAVLSVLAGPAARATTWYVTPSGDDAADCQTLSTPCLTINGAIGKAADGDTVLASEGTYAADSGEEVVLINKSLTISGGWDTGFVAQGGTSIIDGGGVRRGVTVNGFVSAAVARFTIQHGLSNYGGGGIKVLPLSGSLTLIDSTITKNMGVYQGGGISSFDAALVITSTTISDNIAGDTRAVGFGGGGGIDAMHGTVVLNNSTVNGNTLLGGFSGAGIHVLGSLEVNNCTVSGNSGGYVGGIHSHSGTVTLSNSTITFNEDVGVYSYDGTVTMQNTIIAVNGKTDCLKEPGTSGTFISGGHNVIGQGEGCALLTGPGDQVGSAAVPIDPMLLPLGNYGGATATHALRSGSPALNAGNPAGPGSGGSACLATDQRGQLRPVGAVCDVGAVEGFVTTVDSVGRMGSNPAIADSVDFAVTFSDPVTGVDTTAPFDDFALATTGVIGATITSVVGSGDTYVVSVQRGSGDGTIRLDVVDNDTIADDNGSPLGGPGVGNGDFTNGEVYTIWGNPRVTSIVREDPDPAATTSVDFTVTFSEPVTGVDLTPPFGDFALTITGAVTGTVSAVSGSGDIYTVTVSLDAHFGNGTIRLDVVDDDRIVDGEGNPLGGTGSGNGAFTSGEAYTVLTIPATLSPAGRISTIRPTYRWTRVPGATSYRYQLYKGSTLVYTKTVSSAICGETVCASTPTTSSGMGSRKWRVRCLLGGRWGSYSPYRTFTVTGRAGYWSGSGLDFSVPADLASVEDFSIYIRVRGCGSYTIWRSVPAPIAGKRFSFRGSFYASGTFTSPTRATGEMGLRHFYIADCGHISGGPFSWTANWRQPVLIRGAEAADSGAISVTPVADVPAGAFRVEPLDRDAPEPPGGSRP